MLRIAALFLSSSLLHFNRGVSTWQVSNTNTAQSNSFIMHIHSDNKMLRIDSIIMLIVVIVRCSCCGLLFVVVVVLANMLFGDFH